MTWHGVQSRSCCARAPTRRSAPKKGDGAAPPAAAPDLQRASVDELEAELARRRADDVVPRDRRHGVERRARDLAAAVVTRGVMLENPIIENPTTPPECGWTHKNLP